MNMFERFMDSLKSMFSGFGGGNSGPSGGGGGGFSFGGFFSNLFGGGNNNQNQTTYGVRPQPQMSQANIYQAQPVSYTNRRTIDPATAAVMNPHAVNSIPNQALSGLNSGANAVMARLSNQGGILGFVGAVASPMVQASIDSASYQYRSEYRTNGGAISCAPPGSPMGALPNARGQFGAVCGVNDERMERLAEARQSSAMAIQQRGMDKAIETVGHRVLDGIYTPRSQGGAFGDLMNKIGGR